MADESLLRTRVLTLPTADSFRRGQFLLLENPSVANDKLYYGIQETAGTYSLKEITLGPTSVIVIVQEGDSTVEASATTLDFDASDFNVTSSPSGEANIALAYGSGAGTPAEGNHTHSADGTEVGQTLTFVGFDNTGGSTTSTVTYDPVVSKTFTLPTGTWTLDCLFWGRIGHTAPGNLDLRLVIDGTNGTARTLSAPDVGAYPGASGDSKASVASGSRTVTGQIKANTAGTAVMTNASLIISATRTA